MGDIALYDLEDLSSPRAVIAGDDLHRLLDLPPVPEDPAPEELEATAIHLPRLRWSPDGGHLALLLKVAYGSMGSVSQTAVAVWDSDGRLVFHDRNEADYQNLHFDMAWPDQRRLFWTREVDSGGKGRAFVLWVLDVDGQWNEHARIDGVPNFWREYGIRLLAWSPLARTLLIETPWPADEPRVAILDLDATRDGISLAPPEALPWSLWMDLPGGRFLEIPGPHPESGEAPEARVWTPALDAFTPLPNDLSPVPAEVWHWRTAYVLAGAGRGVWWFEGLHEPERSQEHYLVEVWWSGR